MAAYPFQDIEKKWQAHWEEQKTFRTPEAPDPEKPKFYVLDMFPYPSGSGLHVGHPEGYTATDIVARYKRMQGFNVLHPMGWDAFGLPAEQYAVETGTHPRETTERNIARFREQLKSLGFSYDWDREVNTTDPKYYKWTQWIFLKLYEHGLAYQAEVPVWWCEELGTVLANEEVIDGKSERGGYPCERVPMRQWMLKITDYADRLLEGLDELDWPDSTKEMQRNWIGRSEGAEIEFPVVGHPEERIKAFTTRPDTLFGATYMVLAPEHPLVPKVTDADHFEEVDNYIREAVQKSELERTELQKEKSGVFTGGHAINPVNGEKIPIWIADYVLATYGTGAIMAVPAHDERDYDFAKTFDLPIREVVQGGDISKGAYVEKEGILINSDSSDRPIDGIAERGLSINGLSVEEAQEKITGWLEEQGVGRRRINYKLRDWLFSRQRYWGEPFPIIHVDGEPKPVPEEDLPVELPDVESYDQFEEVMTPLSAVPEWVETTDSETGEPAERETNTMPQWAGSCWYYLRFIDPQNEEQLVDPEKEKYWMPVDLYIGGSEHAVLHLLYARFWHKVLYDAGVVSTKEPFRKLIHQGLILGEMEYLIVVKKKEFENWMAERGVSELQGQALVDETLDELPPREILLPREVAEGEGARRPHRLAKVEADEVEKRGDNWVLKKYPEIEVIATSHKMSKSRGNVVNPDDIVDEYGADALRLYEMFMGPLEQVKPWSTSDVEGVYRFLNRVWRLITIDDVKDADDLRRYSEAVQGQNLKLEEAYEKYQKQGFLLRAVDAEPTKEQRRLLHETIREVTEDIEDLRFNTAIARMMEFVNAANKWDVVPKAVAEDFVLLLSPFAPHLSEELWQRLGHEETLAYEPWPEWEEEYLKREVVEMAVQVNGTVRGTIKVEAEAGEEEVLERARAEENVARHLNGKKVQREIYVPGRIVNFVAK